jgi:dynactin 1
MLAQFEHIAEAYFSGYNTDSGERALDLAQSLDCDLDMFAAAMGLTKTALGKTLADDG